jgi:predicted amidohydrolase YtcJ
LTGEDKTLLKQFHMRVYTFLLLSFALLISACQTTEYADIVIVNGTLMTLDSTQTEAIALRGGRIWKLGSNAEMETLIGPKTQKIDGKGLFIYPGFSDGHGHLHATGEMLESAMLYRIRTWEEALPIVAKADSLLEKGRWLVGFGWHQEKWDALPIPSVMGYQTNASLSQITQDRPVMLNHASGHALLANEKALELAGITDSTIDPVGGRIIRDAKGKATGVLEENAMLPVQAAYERWLKSLSMQEQSALWKNQTLRGQTYAISKGLTGFHDAGSTLKEIAYYRQLVDSQAINMRLYVMILESFDSLKNRLQGFPEKDRGGFLTIRSVKAYADGALGSRGALLLSPYQDQPTHSGLRITELASLGQLARLCEMHGLQLCVHAIGDRANRDVLDLMALNIDPRKDQRWRIEHAQHLDLKDIPRFAQLGVIASMQGIHCTSDAPFVIERLGHTRAREGAYAWQSLRAAGAHVCSGTDTPIEDLDPIHNFYAWVTRQRVDDSTAFFPDQRLTRLEALLAYTRENAYASFKEAEQGQLKQVFWGDLTILDQDLLHCADTSILNTKVRYTIVNGVVRYQG